MLTSAPRADRSTRRTWWFVYGIWAAMTLQVVVFLLRYPHPGPIIDEWEFIPAVTGEEPFVPWLWQLHNEHRFPLPRLIWLPIVQITGDFSAGIWLTLLGVSFLALLMIDTAKTLRGRLNFADAFFPLTLLHTGQGENWLMGYQICFMMNLLFAGILLRIILFTNRENLGKRGLQAGAMTFLLLGCGAGGLAYGPFMALWFIALIFWIICSTQTGQTLRLAVPMALMVLAVPFYIVAYRQGYVRPAWHPDPVEVWGGYREAIWQSTRIALQALSMAFGPAATGLWPISAFVISLAGFESLQFLGRIFASRIAERPRALGLMLFLAALAFVAFGIGWGRCGFLGDDEGPGYMGMAARYTGLVWPALGTAYFLFLIYGSPRFSKWGPFLLLMIAALMFPFNVATGFIEGERSRQRAALWEQSVRSGMDDEALIEKFYGRNPEYIKERMRTALRLLRQHRLVYYRPLSS